MVFGVRYAKRYLHKVFVILQGLIKISRLKWVLADTTLAYSTKKTKVLTQRSKINKNIKAKHIAED